ncbi:glycosyltransferase [Derxia gummosa]|uniref:Glycosyltransferase n=1 Tax=Derxia gummosa DSM 723 TaxID=1121388 RepID=A0A8B6X497_9BURK|nr:glycosyltransferase [Derxia gummosa]
MRILFVSANYGGNVVGGAQVSIRLVAEEMVKLGHDVAVASIDDGKPDLPDWQMPGLRRFRFDVENLYWRPARRPGALRRLAWHLIDRSPGHHSRSLGRIMDDFMPDVVHTNVLGGVGSGPWRAARRRGIPIVHSVHDYYVMCLTSGMRRGGNCARPCKSCDVLSSVTAGDSALVDGVIYVSQHMRDTHRAARRFAGARHETILHGPQATSPVFPARPPLRHGTPVRFGYLGRIAPDKGIDRLLNEFRRLPDCQTWTLKVAGNGSAPYTETLRARSAGLPVEFVGVVEARRFFQSIDVLVVPSLWNEPAARVVYEAGLAGVAPIVSRRGGLPELVAQGSRGWVYEPDEAGALAALLEGCINAPATIAARANAWESVTSTFAIADVTARTLDFYRQVIASRTTRARHSRDSEVSLEDTSLRESPHADH